MRSIRNLTVGLFILGSLVVPLLVSSRVNAQAFDTSDCYNSTIPYYDARTAVQTGAYDVFVKLGKRGQSTPTTLYIENADATSCITVGTANATGDNWQKLGSYTAANNAPVRFQLAAAAFDTQANANRPTVMLVPQQNPPCQPKVSCEFTFENQPAYVIPTGTLLTEDTLHVVQVHDVQGDTVKQVAYYADGQLLYTTPTLQPFNLRYVPGG